MNLSQDQLQFIINSTVEQIVFYLQEDYGYTVIDAFDKVYNSHIYEKLQNTKTGLYLMSPDYVYDYLQVECGLN